MSLLHIEFISADQFIKDEIDIKEESDPDEIFGMQQEDEAALAEDEEKCGEVFLKSGHYILVCSFCNDCFESLREFGDHIQSKHLNTEDNHDMNEPAEEFEEALTATEVNTNFLGYSPSSPQNICMDTKMNSRPELRNIEASKADPELFCAVCMRQYRDKRRFKQHQARHINAKTSEEGPISIQEKNLDFLKCKYCGKPFSNFLEWDEHRKTHISVRSYQCPYCPKTFSSNGPLTSHINSHTGDRPYKCDMCPKTFTQVSNMKRHVRSHLGDKRFACEVCGKHFQHNSERESHMRSHTGEKPFQCEECGASYTLQSKLTEHRKRHTNIKNFKCEICDRSFYSNHSLKSHKVMHSNYRPHKCTECERSFSRRKALVAHLKIHSDKKEYVCNICGKEFAQGAGLYSHKKSHGEKLHLPLV